MTGTVLSGQVKVGDTIELPLLKMQKKVKSMQMFRKPVQVARQGDRVGICVAQLDSNQIERGIAATPDSMITCDTILAAVQKIKFFTDEVVSNQKLHFTVGHQTAVGIVHFFSCPVTEANQSKFSSFIFNQGSLKNLTTGFEFDFGAKYNYEESIASEVPPGVRSKEEESKNQKELGNQADSKFYFGVI
jgi:selenocysteine-specific elongation factor